MAGADFVGRRALRASLRRRSGLYVDVVAFRMAGTWRIVEMDLWDRDAIDLLGPGFIKINADGTGAFRFIAVDGHLDCRYAERGDRPGVDFTWEGNDEGDPAFGRGSAQLDTDGSLRGHIFFHAGDDSGFRAIPQRKASGQAS